MKTVAFAAEAALLRAVNVVSAADFNICFAGQFPGPATCEPCLDADIQGSMCVRHTETGSHWMPCHKSVEECCKNDPEVPYHSPSIGHCVSGSEDIMLTAEEEFADTLLFSEIGSCVSPQYPPLTCEQCPEANTKGDMCVQHGWENCYESVEQCCTDLNIIDYGYGYEYCVNKSGQSTSARVPYGEAYSDKIPSANDSPCIAPRFPAPGICEQCPQLAILKGDLCAWPVGGDWPRLAECYKSVEECCKVYEVLGTAMVDYCVSRSPVPSPPESVASNSPTIASSTASSEVKELAVPR